MSRGQVVNKILLSVKKEMRTLQMCLQRLRNWWMSFDLHEKQTDLALGEPHRLGRGLLRTERKRGNTWSAGTWNTTEEKVIDDNDLLWGWYYSLRQIQLIKPSLVHSTVCNLPLIKHCIVMQLCLLCRWVVLKREMHENVHCWGPMVLQVYQTYCWREGTLTKKAHTQAT